MHRTSLQRQRQSHPTEIRDLAKPEKEPPVFFVTDPACSLKGGDQPSAQRSRTAAQGKLGHRQQSIAAPHTRNTYRLLSLYMATSRASLFHLRRGILRCSGHLFYEFARTQ